MDRCLSGLSHRLARTCTKRDEGFTRRAWPSGAASTRERRCPGANRFLCPRARVPADIGIPSIGQRLSRNSKQVPLLPEAAREGAHEGHVLAQAHAGEHELGEPPRQARAGDLCPRLRESSRQPRRSPSTAAPVLMIPKTKNGRSIASSASMRGLIVSGVFGPPKNSVPSGAR